MNSWYVETTIDSAGDPFGRILDTAETLAAVADSLRLGDAKIVITRVLGQAPAE